MECALEKAALTDRNLVMDLRASDVLQLPGGVSVRLLHKKGRAARLCITAPTGAPVKKTTAPTEIHAPSTGE